MPYDPPPFRELRAPAIPYPRRNYTPAPFREWTYSHPKTKTRGPDLSRMERKWKHLKKFALQT